VLPQLGGDVRLRAAAPDLALARIQFDEQRRDQLTYFLLLVQSGPRA